MFKVGVFLTAIVVIIITLIISGRIARANEVQKGLAMLESSMKNENPKVYKEQLIQDLPAPVRRYFEYALTDGQNYIQYLQLEHAGYFRQKPTQKWSPITGEEYFAMDPPGFFWLGKIPWVSAVDQYINGKGNLKVKLLSLIPVVDAKGEATNQGEFLRWLAEAIWYPTALLPSETIAWEAVDEDTAKIIFEDEHVKAEGVFRFNKVGQITHFTTYRYMEDDRLERWTTHCKDYRAIHGMQVPFYAEVSWNLAEGDFCYAKFQVEALHYDAPAKQD